MIRTGRRRTDEDPKGGLARVQADAAGGEVCRSRPAPACRRWRTLGRARRRHRSVRRPR